MDLERPLAQFAGRGAGDRAMQGIHLGQRADVVRCVAPRERYGRCSSPIFDSAGIGVLLNTACDLGTG